MSERLDEFDELIEMLRGKLDAINKEKSDQERRQENAEQTRKLEIRLEEERAIEDMRSRVRIKKEWVNNLNKITNSETKAKLPKLVITKFKGMHIDWFRFWNQFEVETD